MTRKKLGLGLLETFSEACEVCAGRGVIVHHDPVVKHRSAAASNGNGNGNGNRRGGGRGGNGSAGNGTGGGNGNGAPAAPAGGTHVITEGVKSALAQIAASTIHPTVEDPAVVEAAVVASVEAVLDAKSEPPVREKRPRKKREPKAPRTEKDALLESVLEALPEPKAPGQGRSRRRVTTAALTGTPVSAHPADDA
jgi:ribonuclease E